MKPSLVPITCGTALALMAGAAAGHWSTVREMSKLAAALPAQLPPARSHAPAITPLPDDGLAREAKSFLAQARRADDTAKVPQPPPATAQPPGPASDTDSRVEKLLTLLESTVEQNQELRDRIGETNRDLLELRFQVDSYDGQFRPLKVEEEPTFYDDGSGGVLPPIESP
jgi:hypothetical protein